MQLLYGSQNFGYDTAESDRDFIKFTFPTWEDILAGNKTEKEINCPTGIIKIKDIRAIKGMLNKPNFSSLQFMYSTEYNDCEDLEWFIQNRERLIRADIYNMYKHNLPIIRQNVDTLKPKNITRAFVYLTLLKRILNHKEKFSLHVAESKEYRERVESKTNKVTLMTHARNIESEAELLEWEFEIFKDRVDLEILQAADNEIIRLLKKHLG